jgi:hypothetical protein
MQINNLLEQILMTIKLCMLALPDGGGGILSGNIFFLSNIGLINIVLIDSCHLLTAIFYRDRN